MSNKKIIIYALLAFLFLPLITFAYAQDIKEHQEIKGIVLEDGSAIEGQIIFMSADVVKIRTKDGSISSYSFIKDVQYFIKEDDLAELKADDVKGAKEVRAGCLPEMKADQNITDCGISPVFKEPVVETSPVPLPQALPVAESKPEPIMEKPVATVPAKQKVLITLGVEFDINKTIVKEKYYEDIKRVADFMKENPDSKASIEGHTDNAGDDAYNKVLSEKRAENVRQYIIDKFGIDGKRITTSGFGEELPIADNDTAEGRQKNRRVEAILETQK